MYFKHFFFLNIFHRFCLIFTFKEFGLPPLHMQNAYSKQFLGIIILLVIFKIFAALLTTLVLQKDDMVICFLWCF